MAITTQSGTLASSEYTTSDSSWHVAFDWTVANFSNHLPGSLYAEATILCRNPSTGASAYWLQPIGVKFDADSGQFTAELPALLTSKKELGLLLTAIDVDFSGESLQIKVKGLSSTTLVWAVGFIVKIGQRNDS